MNSLGRILRRGHVRFLVVLLMGLFLSAVVYWSVWPGSPEEDVRSETSLAPERVPTELASRDDPSGFEEDALRSAPPLSAPSSTLGNDYPEEADPEEAPVGILSEVVSSRPVIMARPAVEPASSFDAPYVLREETRRLRPALFQLGEAYSASRFDELEFPLFDDGSIVLTDLSHESRGDGAGVFTARVMDDPGGGHVVLSYHRRATAGTIHVPSRGEYYDLRTGPDGVSVVLTQLDPEKVPVCAVCAQGEDSHHEH